MRDTFIFNPITLDDIEPILHNPKCYVDNLTDSEIRKEVLYLASFFDETLGESVERADFAVYIDGNWSILDGNKYYEEELNEIPLDYVLANMQGIEKVLVMLRRMSCMPMDKVKDSANYILYNILDEKYAGILKDYPVIDGILARYRICLDPHDITKSNIENNPSLNDYEKGKVLDWVKHITEK